MGISFLPLYYFKTNKLYVIKLVIVNDPTICKIIYCNIAIEMYSSNNFSDALSGILMLLVKLI